MKAMILAAGRGERMRPLTDHCPKPLLKVADQPLIAYHLAALANIGVKDVVINHAWLGEHITAYCGDGRLWGVNIHYAPEAEALETAGGIINALPLLTEQSAGDKSSLSPPFLVINGDVFTDFTFESLPELPNNKLAHLYLVPNPEHHPEGDFALNDNLLANKQGKQPSYTFSGIGLYRPEFFYTDGERDNGKDKSEIKALGPLLRAGADQQMITASLLPASWTDVGTPERLAQLNQEVR